MSKRVHTIRKAFLIPLGIDAVLLCSLFVLSLLSGSTTERLVFAIFFFPSLYLFLECVLRLVTVYGEWLVIPLLWREKKAL